MVHSQQPGKTWKDVQYSRQYQHCKTTHRGKVTAQTLFPSGKNLKNVFKSCKMNNSQQKPTKQYQ